MEISDSWIGKPEDRIAEAEQLKATLQVYREQLYAKAKRAGKGHERQKIYSITHHIGQHISHLRLAIVNVEDNPAVSNTAKLASVYAPKARILIKLLECKI